MSHQLSPAAESLREEIKVLITKATCHKPRPGEVASNFYEEDENGNRAYGGSLLGTKISQLMTAIELGKDWGWSLAYFSQSRPIINKFSRMWLVPLSSDATITAAAPANTTKCETLREGYRTFISDAPILSSPSTVIFFAPRIQ